MGNTAQDLNVELSGLIDERDLSRAARLHLRPRPVYAALGILLMVLFAWMAVLDLSQFIAGQVSFLHAARFPGFLGFILAYLFAGILWLWRRAYRKSQILHSPVTMSFSDDGLHAASEYGESRLPWHLFYRFKENRHLFLL